ncbi:MAG: hypothetical protein AAGU74_12570 [Bacillota bacterium]
MSNSFFTNTIWYIALAATSAAALTTIFIKTPERKKMFAFWFAVLGFTYVLEVSLLLLFNAYTYYPMITPDDPFFDAVFGNIFSQVSVSSSAVLVCVIGLSNWWLAGFSAAYFLIDMLFVQLGIYEHFWYRSVFSLGGFFIYGLIVKYWYNKVFSGPRKWINYPTLFLSAFAITGNLMGTVLKLLDLRVFQSAFYPDPSRNHTATALIYVSLMIVIMMALLKWGPPWWQRLFVFLLLLVCQFGLLQSGVMAVMPGWEIIIILFDLAAFYGWTVNMDRCLQSGIKSPLPPR